MSEQLDSHDRFLIDQHFNRIESRLANQEAILVSILQTLEQILYRMRQN